MASTEAPAKALPFGNPGVYFESSLWSGPSHSAGNQPLHHETHEFSPEVKKLLHLIRTGSESFMHRDIVLRELLANAADALDRARFDAATLARWQHVPADPTLQIRVVLDRRSRTLTVWDSGVGMTRAQLLDRFDHLFKHGTRGFLRALETQKWDNSLTQFGVGFFSSFLVAEAVAVVARHDTEPQQHVWFSDGGDSFTVFRDVLGEPMARGTKVILRLQPRYARFLRSKTVRHLVDKHADFIAWPILLWSGKRAEWTQLNAAQPVWTKPPGSVSRYEYFAFYQKLTGDAEIPLCFYHFTVQNGYDFTAALFVPHHADWDVIERRRRPRLELFVQRVRVLAEPARELLPDWLGFVRGVVDTHDLPRENVPAPFMEIFEDIGRLLVGKCLEMLHDLADCDPLAYHRFYGAFGGELMRGLLATADPAQRAQIGGLQRFHSSHSSAEQVSLAEYVARMRRGQRAILFVAGATPAACAANPLARRAMADDLEVLYVAAPCEPAVLWRLESFGGFPLVLLGPHHHHAPHHTCRAPHAAAAWPPDWDSLLAQRPPAEPAATVTAELPVGRAAPPEDPVKEAVFATHAARKDHSFAAAVVGAYPRARRSPTAGAPVSG